MISFVYYVPKFDDILVVMIDKKIYYYTSNDTIINICNDQGLAYHKLLKELVYLGEL